MNILTLDLATSTGWAFGSPGAVPSFGTHVLPSTGANVGRFLASHADWMRSIISENEINHVCFEAPILPKKTQIVTLRKLYSLAGLTELMCHRHGIDCTEADNSKVKKYFAGKSYAKKPEMIAAAKDRGFDVRNDDEADAIAIWIYTVNRFDRRNGTDFARRWDLVLGQVA